MKILVDGYKYELDAFEGKAPQTLQFIQKESVTTGPDHCQMRTVNDGTTNEEVLKVLIDRLKFLNNKFSCRENEKALTHLEEALMWLNKRTAERQARNVEGKATP